MCTCFQKKKSRVKTFRLDQTETMIDYILVDNKYRGSVKDVTVIPCEETSTLSSADGYGTQKECQEESKIQKEIGCVCRKRELYSYVVI